MCEKLQKINVGYMKQDPMVNFQKVISLSVRHLQNRYQMSYRGQFEESYICV